MELTEEQRFARAVGIAKGVPEEFAINCKFRLAGALEMKGVHYVAGQMIDIYDSRIRDKLRSRRLGAVVSDAWYKPFAPATIQPSSDPVPDQVELKGTSDEQPQDKEASASGFDEASGYPARRGGPRKPRQR